MTFNFNKQLEFEFDITEDWTRSLKADHPVKGSYNELNAEGKANVYFNPSFLRQKDNKSSQSSFSEVSSIPLQFQNLSKGGIDYLQEELIKFKLLKKANISISVNLELQNIQAMIDYLKSSSIDTQQKLNLMPKIISSISSLSNRYKGVLDIMLTKPENLEELATNLQAFYYSEGKFVCFSDILKSVIKDNPSNPSVLAFMAQVICNYYRKTGASIDIIQAMEQLYGNIDKTDPVNLFNYIKELIYISGKIGNPLNIIEASKFINS